MTVAKLSDILSGMPSDAVVVLGFDPNKERPSMPLTNFQPYDIVRVVYDTRDNMVELREQFVTDAEAQ